MPKKKKTKKVNKEALRRSKEKYRQSERGKIRQRIDDYLYKKDEKFIRSKKILEELGEREKVKRTYKKNYIIFNIPEEIFSKEEKMKALGMTEEEWKKYWYTHKPPGV